MLNMHIGRVEIAGAVILIYDVGSYFVTLILDNITVKTISKKKDHGSRDNRV
jgi:hypothetical protein